MVFLNALQSMLSIMLLTCVGYVLARRGRISAEIETFIPKFVTDVAVPPYLMGAVVQYFDRERLLDLAVQALVPLTCMLAVFLLFLGIARLANVDPRHRRLASVGAAVSNTIYIGIPVNQALFGDAGLPTLLVYFMTQTVFFWTVGCFAIASEGTIAGRRPTLPQVARKILSTPLLGTLTGILLVLLDVPVPAFVLKTCSMLGGLCTPLALIFVGIILCRVDWTNARMGKDILLAIGGRVVLSPLVMIAVVLAAPIDIDVLPMQVFIVQAGLPCMTNIALQSAYFGADRDFGSAFTCLTTIVGMVTVPLWMTAVSLFL